jgi:hypothetical protein
MTHTHKSFTAAIEQMEAAVAEERLAHKRLAASKAFIRVEEAKHAVTVAKTRLVLARRIEMMQRIKDALVRGPVRVSVTGRDYLDLQQISGITTVPESTYEVASVHCGKKWIGLWDSNRRWHNAECLLYRPIRADIATDCDGVRIEPPPDPLDKHGRFISTSVQGTGA